MLSFIKTNLAISIIILIIFSYLGIKALNPDGWDGWGFGSAQTLMSSQYWAKDGFAKNYFLFIPQPYSKLIRYFDSTEFISRPIDTLNGELARNRLYYTHYPPLYLFPYALIAKMGIETRSVYRIFSLLISLTGLLFFYLFIKSASTKATAIIASIYYGFSITFLNYADAISVQPWDILFIFLILYLNSKEKRREIFIWLSYFALSLLSYDATFFVFAFLVLSDIFILKKFFWRRWIFLATAPILGFVLQVIQNTWYLGWYGMIRDFSSVYADRTFRGLKNFTAGLIAPFYSMASLETVFIFKKSLVALTSAAAILGILWKSRQKINLSPNFFKIAVILGIAAVTQPFFINATGGWPFQGVLAAPFWGLLIGAASVFIFNVLIKKEPSILYKPLFGILIIAVLILWSAQFYSSWLYAKEWPNNKPDQKIIEFSKALKTFYGDKERIAFRIAPQNPIWKSHYGTFNMDYYFGMPKIDFANAKDLMTDLLWLRNVSKYPFYSFIVSEKRVYIENIRQELVNKNIKNISSIMEIQDQYIFIVGPT